MTVSRWKSQDARDFWRPRWFSDQLFLRPVVDLIPSSETMIPTDFPHEFSQGTINIHKHPPTFTNIHQHPPGSCSPHFWPLTLSNGHITPTKVINHYNPIEITVCLALQDPQYLHHVLTSAVGPKLFYRLPLLSSRFMRKIALHQECMVSWCVAQTFLVGAGGSMDLHSRYLGHGEK